jgi:hypothetical protein
MEQGVRFHYLSGAITNSQLDRQHLLSELDGVDDGFRTRDLRIHNPAL